MSYENIVRYFIIETNWLELYQQVIVAFTDPTKRVFWGYLLLSVFVAFVWLRWFKRKDSKQAFFTIFSRKVWWSQSAKADYAIFLINKLSFLFIAPLIITQLAVATWLFEYLHELLGYRIIIGDEWPKWIIVTLFTLTYFLLDDFSRFYVHKLLHEVPALWLFHKTHHSARTLTPITVFRTHPVEGIIFALRSVLVQGILIALFVFFFGPKADLYTVLGVGLFAFLFNTLGANLRHSHIGIGYPDWLERFLISPVQHQIHHSTDPQHFDKNYGVILAIWDRLFNSLVVSTRGQLLAFGLSREEKKGEQNLLFIYFAPFKELSSLLKAKEPANKSKGEKLKI